MEGVEGVEVEGGGVKGQECSESGRNGEIAVNVPSQLVGPFLSSSLDCSRTIFHSVEVG